MRVTQLQKPFFDALTTHYAQSTETVIVFLVINGEPLTLTDVAATFPSDGLISQLNLLRATRK